jgi:hypothetical protein
MPLPRGAPGNRLVKLREMKAAIRTGKLDAVTARESLEKSLVTEGMPRGLAQITAGAVVFDLGRKTPEEAMKTISRARHAIKDLAGEEKRRRLRYG